MREKSQGYQGKQKNQIFRKNIRQKELESFFEERRRQILMENNMGSLMKDLGTTIKQQEFLADCGRQLTGQPQPMWSNIICQLKRTLPLFSGQFDVWISQNIISSLAFALKIEYKYLMLAPEICSLLTDMVALAWDYGTTFTQKLMEYEPVPNIIALLDDSTYPIQGRIQMIAFLGNMAAYSYKYRDSIVRDGAGPLFILMGKQLLQKQELDQLLLYKYLGSSQGFLRIFNKPKGHIIPNLNFVNSYLPILISIIINERSIPRTLKMGVKCLTQILRIEKEVLYSNIFQFKDLIIKLISLLQNPQIELRGNACLAFNFLTYSEKSQIPAELLALGILDSLAEAYSKYQHSNSDCFIRTLMVVLSNIAINSEAMAETIFQHRIFGVLIQQFSSTNAQNQKEAFFSLNSMIQRLKFNSLQKVIGQFDILKYLIKGLLELRNVDSKAVLQILTSISILLQRTQEVYYPNGNPLVDRLERFYNFTMILESLSDNCRNKLLSELINKVHNQLLQTHLHDSPIL